MGGSKSNSYLDMINAIEMDVKILMSSCHIKEILTLILHF